jgi:2'-5' RNA ligase
METVRKVSFSPFPVCVGRVTVNNPKRPFTVWCDVQDNGQGALLRHRIEDVLAPMGFMRESRPFTAHATVARIKQFDASLMEVLKNLSSRTFGECKITGMKLKKSTLTRTGPLYEDLLEVTW